MKFFHRERKPKPASEGNISRRKFLKWAGITVGAAGLGVVTEEIFRNRKLKPPTFFINPQPGLKDRALAVENMGNSINNVFSLDENLSKRFAGKTVHIGIMTNLTKFARTHPEFTDYLQAFGEGRTLSGLSAVRDEAKGKTAVDVFFDEKALHNPARAFAVTAYELYNASRIEDMASRRGVGLKNQFEQEIATHEYAIAQVEKMLKISEIAAQVSPTPQNRQLVLDLKAEITNFNETLTEFRRLHGQRPK